MTTQRKPDWYIDQIVDLMCRGAWIRGRSRRQLAAEWKLPVSTVANYATVATKLVKGGTDEDLREEVKATSVEILQIYAAKAAQKERFNEATRSIRVLNEITGAIQGGSVAHVSIAIGDKRERVPVTQAAEVVERAYAFFADKHPELLGEFLEYVGAEASAVTEAPALPAVTPRARART